MTKKIFLLFFISALTGYFLIQPHFAVDIKTDTAYKIIKIPLKTKYLEGLGRLDINQDGMDELLVLTNYDGATHIGQLLVYQWNGKKLKKYWKSKEISGYPYGLKTVDVDSDGKEDVLVSCSGLRFFRNDGNKLIDEGNVINYTANKNLLYEDLDGDNLPDLGVGSPGAGTQYVKLYKQSENESSHVDLSLPVFNFKMELKGTGGHNMVKGINTNKDTNLDILNGELYSGDIYVFRNKGNFKFKKTFTYQFKTRIFSIESADFDGDLFEDFIIAEAWANIHFFRNLQGKKFKIEFEGSSIGSCFNTLTYDINNDDKIDLIAATHAGPVYLYKNKGGFNFDEIVGDVSPEDGNYGLVMGDFNGDGKSDMAIGVDPVIVVLDAPNSFGMEMAYITKVLYYQPNRKIVIKGVKFGANKGTIKIDGNVVPPVKISLWKDKKIIIKNYKLDPGIHGCCVLANGEGHGPFKFEVK